MNLSLLAACLHELGKFAQRAGVKLPPSYQKQASSDYTVYTCYFIDSILPLPPDLESSRSKLALLASSLEDEKSQDRESRAIYQSINLASGLDTPLKEQGTNSDMRLDSIFSRLRLAGKGLPANAPPEKYKLAALDSGKAIFPTAEPLAGSDYKELWQEFTAAIARLPTDLGFKAWQSSLISILERYCWCIPIGDDPIGSAISLFDLGVSAAAICQAILACPENEEKFLLFGGDLSGIQSFIFGKEQGGDKGAVRLLRARSFLLQAITRSIWLCLLERLNLQACAKIMDAGGRFILLLPDLPQIRTILTQLEEQVESWLLENFQGSVRMNFAALPLTLIDLKRENFTDKFAAFNDVLEQAKLKPFSNAIKAGLLPVPKVDFSKYENGECESCHARPKSSDSEESDCLLCENLKKLGRVLPEINFIAFSRNEKEGRLNFNNLLFDNLGLHFYEKLPNEADAKEALEILSIKGQPYFTLSPIAGHVPVITGKDMDYWRVQGLLQTIDGKNYFMGEECSVGNQKTFSMLAQAARIPPENDGEPWHSIAALGVCKADVDNLGLIFSMGFGKDFSLSRFAMLARMLNHFFSGWLIRLIREAYPNLYVIFAGGDDVFVIGPWSDTITFACQMAAELDNFSGHNPAVSISCGLPVIKPGLPMRGIREEAENALEQAKHYESKSKDGKLESKNAITLFGQSAHWPEANKHLEDGAWLAELCEQDLISQGFVRRLLGYSRECAAFLKGEKLSKNSTYLNKLQKDLARRELARNALYKAHMNYDLARNWKSPKPSEASLLKDLTRIKAMAQEPEIFSKAQMGISWALYRTRTTS